MNKILVFGITDIPGGMESVIMNYYRNIDREKFQFDFLCNTDVVAYEDEIKQLGGTIYRITARSKSVAKYKKDMTSFFTKHANEYIAIWVNVCSLANIDYLKYAKKYGIQKRIIHCHNSQNMDSKLRGLLHRYNKLFVKNYATDFWSCAEDASKWFYSESIIKGNKYVVLQNAINLEKYKYRPEVREKYRKKLGLENDIVIGHIGRFHFQKNHVFLINIFNEFQKMHKNSKLLLIGTGDDEEKIKHLVSELSLNNKVLFMESRDDVECLLQAMDIFVFPSLFEGLPVSLVEAQAAGIPIIASKEGVPDRAKMVDNFEFISLNKDEEYWAERIVFADFKNNSEENLKSLRKNGFDIFVEKDKIMSHFN